MTENEEYMEIDLLKLMKALWKKAWAIILVAVIFGGAMFAYGKSTYVPIYTAKTTLYASYVKNQDVAFGSNAGSISQSSLSEARSLVDTCIAVLNTRTMLEAVIETADLHMTYSEPSSMITAAAVNKTELFTVEVTGSNAEETALLANVIGEILPEKVFIVNSSSDIGVIDRALVPGVPNANSIVKNTAVAAVLGAFLACAVVVVKELVADWKASKKENIEEESN